MTEPLVDIWSEAIEVADAVLYEHMLGHRYPASPGADLERSRVGVLAPVSDADGDQPTGLRTEVLCQPAPAASLRLCLRFWQLRAGDFEADGERADQISLGGVEHVSFTETVERRVEATFSLAHLRTSIGGVPFEVPAAEAVEEVGDRVRLVRRCAAVGGLITVSATELPGPYGAVRLRVCVTNTSGADGPGAAGSQVSFIGPHLLLWLSEGAFISMTGGPGWAGPAIAELVNEHTWPVLVGKPGRRDTVLSAPIILRDYPAVAASPGSIRVGVTSDDVRSASAMTEVRS